ncbi:MAG: hypothetical protein ACOY93_14615 [Bacillota bacterium]
MRWALIGGGDVANKRVIAALRQAEGSELVCLVGRSPDRTRATAERHGIPAWYTDMAAAHGLAAYHFNAPASHSLTINGTAGRILSPHVDRPELIWIDGEGAEHREDLPRHENVNLPLIENFTAAARGEAEPLVPAPLAP